MKLDPEEIRSARQLQQILSFQQESPAAFRQSLQTFKFFLEPLVKREGAPESGSAQCQRILLEYLESQRTRDDDERDSVFLPHLMQAWSLASQTNNDTLLSAVPAVLALLLRVISTKIAFQDFGLRLCRTLLLPAQLKLFARGTSANKTKEHVIAPCLRLLTEMVCFDGGALAKRVYAAREFTFKGLARNLGLRRASSGDLDEDRRKPSVRTNALRYLLSNFQFQNAADKSDALGHRDIVSAIFRDIKDDPSEIIGDTLKSLREHVILDMNIHKGTKKRLLTEWALGRIGTLYRHDQILEPASTLKSVEVQAHELLILVCTTPGLGVLLPQTGWYPPGFERDEEEAVSGEESVAVDRVFQNMEETTEHIGRGVVRNSTLSAFAQSLRPYASTMQSELLLEIFKAAPELVADYYFRKTNFSLDPKLTTTWIGYSAFVFSTVQLPVPKFFGRQANFGRRPPPVALVIENILPQPLSQKVLARCMNQSSKLVTFFAIRLLVVAFQKLGVVLQAFRHASRGGEPLWDQGSSRLVDEFCRRCPKMKDVITAFRNSSDQEAMQREAITKLLALYYRVTPQVALDEKLDVSGALAARLSRIDTSVGTCQGSGLHLLELDHLLQIAKCTPEMRWWHSSEQLKLSPLTMLLKLLVNPSPGLPAPSIKTLVWSIIQQSQLLQIATGSAALDALIASLKNTRKAKVTSEVFEFLGHSMARYVQKPSHYQCGMEALATSQGTGRSTGISGPLSPLLVTLIEQWPFAVKSTAISEEGKTSLTSWLARFMGYLRQVGESDGMLSKLAEICCGTPGMEVYAGVWKKSLRRRRKGGFEPSAEALSDLPNTDQPTLEDTVPMELANADDYLVDATVESVDASALFRWVKKDIQDVIEDGDAGGLIMCLCADEIGLRRQALSGIAKLVAKLQHSTYVEQEMVALLLQELAATARTLIDAAPLSTYLAVFASRAVLVQANPQHCLYGKINHFLHQGPRWDAEKLPLMHKILLHPPDNDDAHYEELGWLLDTTVQGLRTARDMDIYRRSNVFERFLSLYITPHLPHKLKMKIASLLVRAANTEGGSTTLITRAGVLSWIEGQVGSDGAMSDAQLKQLAGRLWSACDKERVEAWSGGLVAGHMAHLVA